MGSISDQLGVISRGAITLTHKYAATSPPDPRGDVYVIFRFRAALHLQMRG